LFGIRTSSNGFSSAAEEMKTAYSIMQTMTIFPFQNLILNSLTEAFKAGGIGSRDLYFEQLTPLVILTDTADDTDQSIDEVQKEVDDTMQSEETTEDNLEGVDEAVAKVQEQITMEREQIRFSEPFFDKNYI
jgi:septal ring factor EnvC (AmiA/AmiB activator)